MSNLSFKFMSSYFRIRDFFSPPIDTLEKIGIRPGWEVLDYGCGSGSYSIPAARLVGPTGKVFAVDIHASAIHEVQKKAEIENLRNIHTILTDFNTQLPHASIDIVLLFYVLHDFKKPEIIITELNRVIKPGGLISVIDHKFDNDKVVSVISDATDDLKLTETKIRKSKEPILIFTKK
jgi:ubiquinone/menaquinone biosynthesis C-methylase UbiE